jgi:hypothetical protein
MSNLLFVLTSLILFVAFLVLTRVEMGRGGRFFARQRMALDAEVERWSFVATHVDFPAFIRDGSRALVARIIHDVAHGSLIAVRFLERLLTRAVRALRIHHAHGVAPTASANPSSEFVATMKDFKQELRNGRKIEGEETKASVSE